MSTKDKGQDAENQLQPLREFCKRAGVEVAPKEYVDEITAVKVRPEFNRMLADAKARHIDTVLCWKLDRFVRSMGDLVLTIAQLDAMGVRFICTTQGIDTNHKDPIARVHLHIIGVFAEFERSLIKERVQAGIDRRRASGLPVGRQITTATNTEDLARLHKEGTTLRELAAMCGVSESTIQRRLRKRKVA